MTREIELNEHDRFKARLLKYLPSRAKLTETQVEEHIAHMLCIRHNTPWQKDIPEEIFLSFVLPMHVNDEPIVPCAKLFYSQLMPMLSGMDAMTAAIQVNYYCMANVTYRFNDAPTSDVLTIFNRGYGRCGEESTFAVLAYRSVGIPARQVYAVKWSHCEDNHAWVEIYVNGQWHYTGACEAQEKLDCGWFDTASSKAQYIRALCDCERLDPYIASENGRAVENVTDRYAAAGTLKLQVKNGAEPCPNARLSVELFNTGNFDRLFTLECDERGEASAILGMGDVFITHYSESGFCRVKATPPSAVIDIAHGTPDGAYEYTQRVAEGRDPHLHASDEWRTGLSNRRRELLHPGSHTPWVRPEPVPEKGAHEVRVETDYDIIQGFGGNFSIARITQDGTQKLDLDKNSPATLHIAAGRYCFNAYRRGLDGTLYIKSLVKQIDSDCTLKLSMPNAEAKPLNAPAALPFEDRCGKTLLLLCGGDDEPTRHIESELKEQENTLISREIRTVRIDTVPCDALERVRELMHISGDALPILVAVKDGMGLHAVCGYNVGSVELLCELLR